MTKQTATREDWLMKVTEGFRPVFDELGHKLPPVRMAIGFPSTGARGKRIGECWSDVCSGDNTHEIFIHPSIDNPMRVAGILVHELVHAAVGIPAGHGPKFRKLAVALGLEGKMTATTEGEAFKQTAQPILDKAGPLPHAALSAGNNGEKKQSTRMIKCECPCCGYTVRTSRKWIDEVGAPICPADNERMIADID